MAKSWQCTQCGQKVTTGLQESWSGETPTECETCGNDGFEELRTTGTVHKAIDGEGAFLQRRQTRRRAIQTLGAGAVAAGGAWWFFGRPTVVETTDVSMHDAQFHPRNIEVDTGATVVWENEADSGEGEPITYLLRSATDGWDFEENVSENDNTAYTFEESGVYGLYAQGLGQPNLTGMSMKIGVGTSIDDPVGGWF